MNEIFDFLLSSCYVHVRKPDAAIFRIALDGAQVPVDEIISIDDVQMFVDVAIDLDITSIHHTDYLFTSKALTDLGITIKHEKIKYA